MNLFKDISSSVTYEIVSGDQNLFKINPETGEIKTIKGLDYEQQRMHFLTISTEEARGTFNLGTYIQLKLNYFKKQQKLDLTFPYLR